MFGHQVLVCPHCQGPRTILAAITEPEPIRAILTHLRLPTDVPTLADARAPPQLELLDH